MDVSRSRTEAVGRRFDYHRADERVENFPLRGFRMKGLLAAFVVVAVLYVADQQYARGKYTDAIASMMSQMRHSFRM
jgi:Tfp pilus assembly protein PilP